MVTLRPVSRSSWSVGLSAPGQDPGGQPDPVAERTRRGDEHVQHPVVGTRIGNQPMLASRKPTLPTTMTWARRLIGGSSSTAIVACSGGMVGVLRRRDEVGSRADRLLQVRVGAFHDHRVDADPGHHREVIRRLIVDAEADQVDRLVDSVEGDVEGCCLVQRDADVASEQVPGAGRDQAERYSGAGQPEQITRIVPSPPAPSTRSTFSRTACSVIARPGSSLVVSSQSARSQPRLFSSYSTCRRNVIQSVTLAGLKMTAARSKGP